jgi:hypothetical protein
VRWNFRVDNDAPGLWWAVVPAHCETGFAGTVPANGVVRAEALFHAENEFATQRTEHEVNVGEADRRTVRLTVPVGSFEAPWRNARDHGTYVPPIAPPDRLAPRNGACADLRLEDVDLRAGFTQYHVTLGVTVDRNSRSLETQMLIGASVYLPRHGVLVASGLGASTGGGAGTWDLWPLDRALDWDDAIGVVWARM